MMKSGLLLTIFVVFSATLFMTGCALDGGSSPGTSTGDTDPSDGDGNDGGTSYTYTVEDLTNTFPGGKYLASVFNTSSTVFDSTVSVTTATALTDGNKLTLSGLKSGSVPYTIFIYIDADGDGDYGDDDCGTAMEVETIAADVEVGVGGIFGTFGYKPVQVTGNTDTDGKTVHCYWVVGGTLSEAMKTQLRTDASQVYELVGYTSAVMGASQGATPKLSEEQDSDFPLPASVGLGFSDITYDLYVYAQGTSDEWHAESIANDADLTQVDVTLSMVP